MECLPAPALLAGDGLTHEGDGEAASLLDVVLRFVFSSPSISNASILIEIHTYLLTYIQTFIQSHIHSYIHSCIELYIFCCNKPKFIHNFSHRK